MSGRKMLRVFCAREKGAHEVGAVSATPDGLRLRIAVAVHDRAGTFGEPETFAPGQEHGTGEAWCRSCGKVLPFTPEDLLTEARAGRRTVRLVAEGMHRDPIGVLQRKHRPTTR